MLALFTFVTSIGLALASTEARKVLVPAAVAVFFALFYFCVVTWRERELPVFEVATFFVVATTVYTVLPLLQYAAIDFAFGPTSDNRLLQWAPTPAEFGGFAWNHVSLISGYVVTYLLLRGRRRPLQEVARPTPTVMVVICAGVAALTLYFAALHAYVRPVSVYQGGTGAEYLRLPYVVLQLTNVFRSALPALKQCLLVALLLRWKKPRYRYALFGWLIAETLFVAYSGESRTPAIILLLTCVVAYHRIVRPLTLKFAVICGTAGLALILVFGALRDLGTTRLGADRRATWGAANEFQILYGTAYDLHARKAMGILPPPPPYLAFVDLYRLIPSQFLPFYKWDPSEWYLDVIGLRGSGVGLMFGVVAQGVIGAGWKELMVRGALLALLHAWFHRLYRRHSMSFWATTTYLYILSWAYFAFRSTSFEIFYRLVYYLAPTLIAVRVLALLLSRVHHQARVQPTGKPAVSA